jgi:two-component system nitrate/nitrite response regulator NarL
VGAIREPRPRIRVVVGDAHPEFRRAFRSTISTASDVEIIGETDDGVRALELLRILRPHVALLDADLPSLGGNAVARVLADELPDVHVVVLEGPE